tara:strand:+ start:2889 stop:3128 length:240 start_codon:yes stop_codon:yes gene_type:complete
MPGDPFATPPRAVQVCDLTAPKRRFKRAKRVYCDVETDDWLTVRRPRRCPAMDTVEVEDNEEYKNMSENTQVEDETHGQ